MFIKSVQDQICDKWNTAEKRFMEDDATPGTPGHVTIGSFVESRYNQNLRDMEVQVRVDFGDHWIDVFTIQVDGNDRLLLICRACDGNEVRESTP